MNDAPPRSQAPHRLAALLLAAAAAALPGAAAAGTRQQVCSPQALEQLRRVWQIGPDAEIVDSACKPWPADGRLLLTLAVFGADDQPRGERSATLGLAMVEAVSFRVVSRHSEPLGEDASFEIGPGVFALDTARYRLAPGVRGFGVVAARVERASCPDGGFDAGWRLYVAEGPDIRPVTDIDLHLRTWRYAPSEACRGDGILNQSTVTLGLRPRPGTWADLVISARRSDRRAPLSITVPYDGRHYPLGQASERISKFDWMR